MLWLCCGAAALGPCRRLALSQSADRTQSTDSWRMSSKHER